MAIYNQGNAGGGGVYPVIIVTAPTGTTVTCSKGSKTLTAPEVDGTWTFKPNDYGVWTITGVSDGNTKTETVDVQEVTTYNVAISFVSTTLNDNDWETIRQVADAGQGEAYWSVGDCKEVTLNGTVGHLQLDNYATYVYIIGFNHNSDLEGVGITFQGFKTAVSGGIDICLVDNLYSGAVSATGYFSMNSRSKNAGGWASSQMRTNICGTNLTSYAGTIIAVIPEALRVVIKSVTKYTDNTGDGSGSMASNVTATTDYFFLLSEYEVFGSISYANSNESSKQAQYSYYSAGNSRVKYKHNGTTTAANWWLRSPRRDDAYIFLSVDAIGTINGTMSHYSQGFAPAFCV